MYCNQCGTKLTGSEKFCFHCGTEIKNDNYNSVSTETKSSSGKKNASIILGIISLVGLFLIIFSPISVILSLIGLIIGIRAHKEVNNVAGIVINAISLFISLIITFIIAVLVIITINISKKVDVENIQRNFDFEEFPWGEITNIIESENSF